MRVFSGLRVQWWWWGSGVVQLCTKKRYRPWWLQISLLVANFFLLYAFLCRHLCRLNDDRSFLFFFVYEQSKWNWRRVCMCALVCALFHLIFVAGVYMKRRPSKGQAHAIGDANWDRAVTIRSDDRLVGKDWAHRDWLTKTRRRHTWRQEYCAIEGQRQWRQRTKEGMSKENIGLKTMCIQYKSRKWGYKMNEAVRVVG